LPFGNRLYVADLNVLNVKKTEKEGLIGGYISITRKNITQKGIILKYQGELLVG
jgi:hypothetical protein